MKIMYQVNFKHEKMNTATLMGLKLKRTKVLDNSDI